MVLVEFGVDRVERAVEREVADRDGDAGRVAERCGGALDVCARGGTVIVVDDMWWAAKGDTVKGDACRGSGVA